jgi:hypothetical protein
MISVYSTFYLPVCQIKFIWSLFFRGGLKLPECGTDYSPPYITDLKMCKAISPQLPNRPSEILIFWFLLRTEELGVASPLLCSMVLKYHGVMLNYA